jgi:hypothetical protein
MITTRYSKGFLQVSAFQVSAFDDFMNTSPSILQSRMSFSDLANVSSLISAIISEVDMATEYYHTNEDAKQLIFNGKVFSSSLSDFFVVVTYKYNRFNMFIGSQVLRDLTLGAMMELLVSLEECVEEYKNSP